MVTDHPDKFADLAMGKRGMGPGRSIARTAAECDASASRTEQEARPGPMVGKGHDTVLGTASRADIQRIKIHYELRP
jgi:hypothetical protein